MTSANDWISEDLKPATLLSVHEENGVITKVYVAPCLEPKTKVEPLVERKPEVFPEANTLLFQCPFCGNGIRTGGAYKVHLMACERRFAWMMKNEGQVVPQLKCSICKETFSSAEALINHRLQHRSPSMKRTCGSCHVKFETELEYRTHLESHLIPRKSKDESYEGAYTITKLFDCLFCRKEFLACFRPGQVSRRYACDECVRRLKAQEAEKKLCVKRKAELCCDRCGRTYKYEGFLNRHLKTCQVPEKFKRKREN